ncbi:MAG: hypothetical protein HYW24_02170 [Candidatus Aenigmarchaeota archaeon]|nr:hypothetical protein [Candidatus Aenigmarchaeota archaeon]
MTVKQKLSAKLFFRIKPVKMLTALKSGPKYATIIAKETDCTYSHTVKLLDLFEEFDLVDFEKKGRIKLVKLTEFGDEIAKTMDVLLMRLSNPKEKV